MTWADLDPEIRAVAEEVCTVKELEALRLWEAGLGYRRIGLRLGIRWDTARDRVKRAKQKIAYAKEERAA